MKKLFLIYLFLFHNLAYGVKPGPPDFSLIKKWDSNYYKNHLYQPFPKIIRFEGTPNLTFVATKHSDWKNSQLKIEFAIRNFKPKIILIEGLAKSDGLSPRVWDDKLAINLDKEGFEAYFAYKIAIQENIPFVGAELDGKMSEHTSYERDLAVVSYLDELLKQYDNVMIIYGAGHFVQQEDCLVNMLGIPKVIQ